MTADGSDPLETPPVNSRRWWDSYFSNHWDANEGPSQTGHFMERLTASLSPADLEWLRLGTWEILDWGCAFGEGVDVLARCFPQSRVSGLDFSIRAVERARISFPQEFIWSGTGSIPRGFDCIVTSNCLEHFEFPLALLQKHLESCRFLYAALVPFNECPLHEQHRAQFRKESFPLVVDGFNRLTCEVVAVDPRRWPGDQLLVAYGSPEYLKRRKTVMADSVSEPEWESAGLDELVQELRDVRVTSMMQEQSLHHMEAQRNDAWRKASHAEAECNDAWRRSRELEHRLGDFLARVGSGMAGFEQRLDQDLAAYRSQRAWQVMLALRKAYTLLIKRRGGGLLAFLNWVGGLDRGGLSEYDLEFPRLSTYLPVSLERTQHCVPPPQTSYDIVILPVFEFSFRFQRPQRLAVELARGHRVFWISPGRRAPAGESPYQASLLQQNLWEVCLQAAVPNLYTGKLESRDVDAIGEGLKTLWRDWNIAECCIVTELPFWRQVARCLRPFGALVVYDCMDHWETFPGLGDFTRGEEDRLGSECDLLVVTGEGLRRKHQDRGRNPVLVRNGVNYSEFASATPSGLLARYSRPIVGYSGAIADWFDYALLREVARLRPSYTFVLIGGRGLETEPAEPESLRGIPNIVLLGHKDHGLIPRYLAEFDVCIIPFLLNEVTLATDPVKLYEYFSLGKPVVATAMSELSQCGDLVYLAENAEDFAAKLDCAVSEPEGDERRGRRAAFAAASTWERRVETLDHEIRNAFPKISILINTYNSVEFVRPCLDSIERNTTYPNYEVIVIDNASTDGTNALLGRMAESNPRVRLIREPFNRGFSRANNRAARESDGEYLVFLNPDTIVTPGWLARLVRPCHADATMGVVVAVTNFAGNEARVPVDYLTVDEMERFALALAQQRMGLSIDIAVAPLFCALLSRSVWTAIGELDEGFELGMFEDDDFSMRVQRSGRRIVTAEDCFVHHFGQGSFNKLPPDRYEAIFQQNLRRFEEKWKIRWLKHHYRTGVFGSPRRFTPMDFV